MCVQFSSYYSHMNKLQLNLSFMFCPHTRLHMEGEREGGGGCAVAIYRFGGTFVFYVVRRGLGGRRLRVRLTR